MEGKCHSGGGFGEKKRALDERLQLLSVPLYCLPASTHSGRIVSLALLLLLLLLSAAAPHRLLKTGYGANNFK